MKKYKTLLFATIIVALLSVVFASAGAGKIPLYNNAEDGIDDGDEEVMGFIVYNQNAQGTLIIEISLKGGIPDTEYYIEFLIAGTSESGGIEDWGHWGNWADYPPEPLTTNKAGNGNLHLVYDVTTLAGVIPDAMNYGHIDLEHSSIPWDHLAGAALTWYQPPV